MRFAYLLLAAMVVSSAFVILPPNANIVLTSVLIVYVGSHFALSPSVDEGGGAARRSRDDLQGRGPCSRLCGLRGARDAARWRSSSLTATS